MQFMDEDTKSKLPEDCTPLQCPYPQFGRKRFDHPSSTLDDEQQVKRARIDEGDGEQFRRIPPDNYVCRICSTAGHWIEDCPQKVTKGKTPPEDYVCRICQTPGHFLKDCPQKEATQTPSEDYVCKICQTPGHFLKDCPQKGKANACWFCMANEKFDDSLVIDVGNHAYLALAKGPLVNHHLLVVPIDHKKSVHELSEDAREEMDSTTEDVCEFLFTENEIPVVFDVFRPYSPKLVHHVHRQIIGVPGHLVQSVSEITERLKDSASNWGFSFTPVGSFPDKKYSPRSNTFYVNFKDPATQEVIQFTLSAPDSRGGVFDIVR
jgi:diadenosine tetraphosphate (Ap4A) HIT family hydrolase